MSLSSFVSTLFFFHSNVHANRKRSTVNIILPGVNPTLSQYHLHLHYDLIFLVPTCDTKCKRSIDRRTDDIVWFIWKLWWHFIPGFNFFDSTDDRSITCARTGELLRYSYYIDLCLNIFPESTKFASIYRRTHVIDH